MKTKQGRFDDAVGYIHAAIDSELALHLSVAAQAGNVSTKSLGAELSLGSRSDKKNDDDYDDHTASRRALRALLLCQRVYFSKIWSQLTISSQGGGVPTSYNTDCWPADSPSWETTKAATVAYWQHRSESEIKQAIKAFAITATSADALSTAAQAPGEARLALPLRTLTRNDNPFPGHGTCYAAVMFWLFRSGLVSYRWMMRNYGNLDMFALKALFGPGRVIWPADKPFTSKDRLPPVPRGHIVHLYIDEPSAWLGHWLVSRGGNMAYGRNNDDEGGAKDRFYDLCSLNKQFLAYKGTTVGRSGAQVVQAGIAEVIDPLQIPNRI